MIERHESVCSARCPQCHLRTGPNRVPPSGTHPKYNIWAHAWNIARQILESNSALDEDEINIELGDITLHKYNLAKIGSKTWNQILSFCVENISVMDMSNFDHSIRGLFNSSSILDQCIGMKLICAGYYKTPKQIYSLQLQEAINSVLPLLSSPNSRIKALTWEFLFVCTQAYKTEVEESASNLFCILHPHFENCLINSSNLDPVIRLLAFFIDSDLFLDLTSIKKGYLASFSSSKTFGSYSQIFEAYRSRKTCSSTLNATNSEIEESSSFEIYVSSFYERVKSLLDVLTVVQPASMESLFGPEYFSDSFTFKGKHYLVVNKPHTNPFDPEITYKESHLEYLYRNSNLQESVWRFSLQKKLLMNRLGHLLRKVQETIRGMEVPVSCKTKKDLLFYNLSQFYLIKKKDLRKNKESPEVMVEARSEPACTDLQLDQLTLLILDSRDITESASQKSIFARETFDLEACLKYLTTFQGQEVLMKLRTGKFLTQNTKTNQAIDSVRIKSSQKQDEVSHRVSRPGLSSCHLI